MILDQVLEMAIEDLKNSDIPEANLNAKVLLANVLKCRREELVVRYNQELEADKQKEYFSRDR